MDKTQMTDAQIRTIACCDCGGYQDDDSGDWEFKDADLMKFARALLAAAAPAPSAPEGWKLVPIEPTEAMRDAAEKSVPQVFSMGDEYRAMVAAAPAPSDAMTPHTMPGFRGGFISLHRRTPTEQEIWNAGVRSGIDRTAPAPSAPTEQQVTDAVKNWFPDRSYQAPFFARALFAPTDKDTTK
jgi:hypothetical protein